MDLPQIPRMLHVTSQKNNFFKHTPEKTKQIEVQEPWFSLLKNGKKKVEGRVFKDFYQTLAAGQNILITKPESSEKFWRIIKSVQVYKDFKTMLENEGLQKVLPGVRSLAEGLQVYYGFEKAEQEKSFGVVAIHLH
eukprot:TRINITY_DN1904_c0_g1_i1.p1 TRINITY_DN1904_c0_g1~~TRINITY_DN1904_c0_g1_i1.p1  ORF type:complete len:136 (+),score=27.96 TRINITY_DN1904_c0_g1_i1:79-486(+)